MFQFKNPFVMTGFCVAVLSLWMISGIGKSSNKGTADAASNVQDPTQVQFRLSHAELINGELSLQAQLVPFKTVKIGAETQGKVVQVLVDKGTFVKKDQPLVKLDMQDRAAKLNEAKTLLSQRTADFESVKSLVAKNVMAKNMLHERKSQLAMAEAQLKQVELDIEHTTIRASFDGFVNDRMVEVGDLVQRGDKIATMVDSRTLLATAFVQQKQLDDLNGNISVSIIPSSGQATTGKLHFLSKVADPNTRSYAIEFKVSNSDLKLVAGSSADIVIKTTPRSAHFISASLFCLSDQGELGVKTISQDNKVQFNPILALKNTTEGTWVTGLEPEVNLITVGQGYVNVGDVVKGVPEPTQPGLNSVETLELNSSDLSS